MNPQSIILGVELVAKALSALRLIHQSPHPKNIHDEISNIINAIEQTAKPYQQEIPAPAETKNEDSKAV